MLSRVRNCESLLGRLSICKRMWDLKSKYGWQDVLGDFVKWFEEQCKNENGGDSRDFVELMESQK